jgi:cleavage and polyadenylation specificity factor subunit 1
VEYFEHVIRGREVVFVTDHKPLLNIFNRRQPQKLQRRSDMIEYLSQFTNQIRHVAGSANIVADALSRLDEPEVAEIRAFVASQHIAEAQRDDEEVKEMLRAGYRNFNIQKVKKQPNFEVVCVVCEDGSERPIVPKPLRYKLFQQLHELAHPGARASIRLLQRRFFWPKMQSDVKAWVRACQHCQKAKVQRHTVSPPGHFPPSARFRHVHTDIVGPMEMCAGFSYVCTFIDRETKWIEAVPVRNVEAETVAKAFFNVWISRYGVPEYVTTDRGSQFRSDLFRQLCKLLGSQHIKTTAYNPKADGMIERVHCQLKAALRENPKTWLTMLPAVLLGLRAAPRDESGTSCAELALGTTLRLPGEFIENAEEDEIVDSHGYVQKLRQAFRDLRPVPQRTRRKEAIFVHPDLRDATHVYLRVGRVRRPLEPPYEGPFRVIKRSKKWFRISIADKEEDVSIDRLKPAYFLKEEDTSPAVTAPIFRPILKNSASQLSKVNCDESTTQRNTQFNSKKSNLLPAAANVAVSPIFPKTPTSRYGRPLTKTVRFQAQG